jgi:hypothetical protein
LREHFAADVVSARTKLAADLDLHMSSPRKIQTTQRSMFLQTGMEKKTTTVEPNKKLFMNWRSN